MLTGCVCRESKAVAAFNWHVHFDMAVAVRARGSSGHGRLVRQLLALLPANEPDDDQHQADNGARPACERGNHVVHPLLEDEKDDAEDELAGAVAAAPEGACATQRRFLLGWLVE